MGAHCTAPTKMDGFDAPNSEYVLRSHHESDWGVAPQVLLREGQEVTMMKFVHPGELMACAGTLLEKLWPVSDRATAPTEVLPAVSAGSGDPRRTSRTRTR